MNYGYNAVGTRILQTYDNQFEHIDAFVDFTPCFKSIVKLRVLDN